MPNVLGVRIPHLRQLAKRIARGDWQAYLATADTYYMEERMLQGMVLGCIRPDDDIEQYLERVTRFVRLINSWSVCDTFKFAGGKRFIQAHRERLWEYLKGWMQAEGEYEIRFGVVMSMAAVHRRGAYPRIASASTTASATRATTSGWAWPGPCPSASSSSPTSQCTI